MKIELDNLAKHAHRISSYERGAIRVGDRSFSSSIIVRPESIVSDWRPQTFAEIERRHLHQILKMRPELILLGTGRRQYFPSAEMLADAGEAGVALEAMDTGAACRSFNILLQEGRNIAAALIMIE